MYRVIIADDEEWIVDNLKASFDWEKLGFQVVDTALDGVEALEKIQAGNIDVIVADIRMLGMDGLELMKRAHETDRDVEFIVISGFAEFAYAQKAMNYGAAGYCLKPLEEADLARILAKVKERLDSRSAPRYQDARHAPRNREEEILTLSEEGSAEAAARLRDIFEAEGFRLSETEGILVVGSIGDGTLGRFPRALECRVGSRVRAYFYQYNPRLPPEKHVPGRIPRDVLGVGFGGVYRGNGHLAGHIESAVSSAFQFFMTGTHGVFPPRGKPAADTDPEELFARLRRESLRGDAVAVKGLLDEAGDAFRDGRLSIRHAFRLYNLISSLTPSARGSDEGSFLPDCDKLVGLFENVDDMLGRLKELVAVDPGIGEDDIPSSVTHETVKSILKHVRANFTKNLSLHDVSSEFHITPGYASHLIKKESGMSFLEYLTGIRMEYARELLRTTRLSVNHIAERCGYEDYLYFRRIFKRTNGSTPTGYRESSL